MLDTQGYVITSFRLLLTKDGVQKRIEYDGNYLDGSSITISDLEAGSYRLSVTAIAGYLSPWGDSNSLKGNVNPSNIQIIGNRNESVILSISIK